MMSPDLLGAMFLWLISQMDYLPKIDDKNLCDWLDLCSVRKSNDTTMIVVKPLWWEEYEIPLEQVIQLDEYEDKNILRSYASGHVLFDQDHTHIYLVATDKKGIKQRQILGGSPREDSLKNIIVHDQWTIKFNLEKAEDNAILRWYLRTWLHFTDSYNELPLVDRVLAEKLDEDGVRRYRNLVLLLHYVVKNVTWQPKVHQVEWVVDGKRFTIDEIMSHTLVAPNTKIIVTKSLELIAEQENE